MPNLRIPLFPLNLVLFPGNPLPLHIFEPRYKLMICRSLDDRSPFGIILAREDGIAAVGCTAEVLRVLKTYDDGRLDIETIGQTPFRIAELHRENPLLEASVGTLEDDLFPGPSNDPGAAESLAAELFTLYAACHAIVHSHPPAPLDNLPGTSLSYQIAGRLPLDSEVQQELLEIRSESIRRTRLAEHLREFLPQLSSVHRRHSNASGNGHNLN